MEAVITQKPIKTITYTITKLPKSFSELLNFEDGNAITVNGEYSIEQIRNPRFTWLPMALVVV